MRGSIWNGLILFAAAGLSLPVLSQAGGSQTASSTAAPHKPQPQHYTAELKDTSVKSLPDGTVITLETDRVMAVDSQGRSMISTTELWELIDGKPMTYFNVNDPVALTSIHWTFPGTKATVTQHGPPHDSGHSDCTLIYTTPGDSDGGTAGGTHFAKPGGGAVARGVVGTGNVTMPNNPISQSYKYSEEEMASNPAFAYMKLLQQNSTTVDLGTTKIQGVEAHGHRATWTTPAGAMGNDQPMTHTQETWITMGDNPRALNVRQVSDDPQSGKSTLELVSLSLEEPDLSVFQPPERYEIVTQELHSVPCRIPKPSAQ